MSNSTDLVHPSPSSYTIEEEEEEEEDEEEIKTDRHPPRRQWRSCCFTMDPTAARFMVQTLFALLLMAFSMAQLSTGTTEDKAYHVSILSLIVGVYLPSPRMVPKVKN